MGEKLVIGPVNRGLRNDTTAFNIDNDSFPYLVNAYQWRGRLKRKRGTSLLGRLRRFLGTTDGAGNLAIIINPFPIATGKSFFTVGTDIFTDPGTTADPVPQVLITNSLGFGALDRVNGVLVITGSIPNTSVIYYPALPVMGLEDIILLVNQFPGTMAFDTDYSYQISTSFPFGIYDVSFYKNPSTGDFTNYVQKGTWTSTWWNGQDYQQFWTTNYQGALWATNGISEPFNIANIGMQYYGPTTIPPLTAAVGITPTTVDFTVVGNTLVVGDFVFANEFTGGSGLNFQTGYVTTAGNVFTVTFPNANIAAGAYVPGILQLLTARSDTTKDNIRWYDGDPTNGSATAPVMVPGKGWVNFMPPLSQADYSIADLPEDQYYLVGAKMILPFKDRLLFFAPVIQTSAAGSQIFLQDTVIFSQNGTPFYTASFDGPEDSTETLFHPILVPINQTAAPNAYWEDVTGYGGFQQAGLDQPINTISSNRDVLIVGFSTVQTQLVYTGNDIAPYNFFLINSELGSGSTFSAINMDQGVLSRGSRGFITTSQQSTERIDLEIPDEVFQISLSNNGSERVCAIRDYINEWAYFTYPGIYSAYKFPNQSLIYNYRDNSWAIFVEAYTTYGLFRKQTGLTWASIGDTYPTWGNWDVPWNSGESTLLKPEVIGGNQQGFVIIKDEGLSESDSLYINNIVAGVVSSPDHTLNDGDYIIITGVQGTVSQFINGRIFSVANATQNTFELFPLPGTGTYLGGGLIKRFYVPYIQTKQFPAAWDMGRKTRIGVQQYLLSTTENAQITLFIFLSQSDVDPFNDGPIVPLANVQNSSLIYSTVLYTCPESTNLGLTPANTNLQMIAYPQTGKSPQNQIWHRINTSLIGDTVQLGFTISDEQMRTYTISGSSGTITGATQSTSCVLTCNNDFAVGQTLKILGVLGMTELNFTSSRNNVYTITAVSATDVTINVDSTAFTPYVSGGTVSVVSPVFQTAEVELHGFILDLTPSQLLA